MIKGERERKCTERGRGGDLVDRAEVIRQQRLKIESLKEAVAAFN